MQADYSKSALIRFLDFVEKKGLLTKQNAQNWRVATAKILDDITPVEEADVRKIDIETAFRRFANRTAGKFNPSTLSEYRRRATLAIQNFVEYASDPEGYKPRSQFTGKTEKAEKRANRLVRDIDSTRLRADELPANEVGVGSGSGLAMPFPLREDFLAQVVIPRDMTTEEARRISAFIMTLSRDFRPDQ